MKIRILIIVIINLFFLGSGFKSVFALEHTQKSGLFSINVPEGWHWVEYPQEIVLTFADGKTMAVDIQLVPGHFSQAEIKKKIKEANDKFIKQGIEAHHGTLIDDKEIKLGGVYATRLDFKTAPPDPVYVTYISSFYKGYAFTVTYGSGDDKMRLVMDAVAATFKFR